MFTVLSRHVCLSIFTAALCVRLVAGVGVQVYLDRDEGREFLISGDAEGYWLLAKQIAAGKPYEVYRPPRQVHRMPLFPSLLAVQQRISGNSLVLPRMTMAVIGALGCLLTYLIGREIADGRTGVIAALLMAIAPTAVGFSSVILSEMVYATLMLAGLYCWTRASKESDGGSAAESRRLAMMCGAAFGLATLTRPAAIVLLPALCVVSLAVIGRDPARLRLALLSLLILGVTLVPWVIRNRAVTGHWILTSLWSGPSLYDGLNPNADGTSNMSFFDQDALMDHMSEYEMNRHYWRAAWNYGFRNPARSAVLAVRKQWLFWNPVPHASELSHPFVRALGALFFIPFLLAAATGLVKLRWSSQGLIVLLVPIAVTAAMHLFFVGSIRYRFPIEFLMAIPAAALVSAWMTRRLQPTTV